MKRNFTYDDELYHYGVKGMKWHKRKAGRKELGSRDGRGKDGWEEESRQTVYATEAQAKELRDMYRNGQMPANTTRTSNRNGDTYSARGNGRREDISINTRQAVNVDGTTNTNRYRATGTSYRPRTSGTNKRRRNRQK